MATAASVAAAGIPKSQISANAKWIVHIDMDRFAASDTCASLIKDPAHGKAFQSYLAHYRLLLGIEPLKDIRQVILYGEDISGSRGVALISGNMDPDLFVRRLSGNAEYRSETSGKLTIHQWLDRNSGTTLAASFYTSKLLLIASDKLTLNAALDVLGGARKSLNDTRQGLPIPASRGGVFFTAVTRGYSGSTDNPMRAAILRNTETATVLIGEAKGIVDAGMRLDAVSPSAAIQIEAIMNGLVVMAGMSDDTNGLGKLAELSQMTRENDVVNVTLRCKASDAAFALASGILDSSTSEPRKAHRPHPAPAGK